MICNREGQDDIAASLGLKPTTVSPATWSGHVYSCSYRYPNGAVSLSVKELATKSATTAYFTSFAQVLGRRSNQLTLGQGAFSTTNGSVVVRKDTKVLFVDISRLTGQLGLPPKNAAAAAVYVAAAVLGCWTGS